MNNDCWEDFWAAFENLNEKSRWRNSVYLTAEESETVEKMFIESVFKLKNEIDRFYCELINKQLKN